MTNFISKNEEKYRKTFTSCERKAFPIVYHASRKAEG